MAEGQRGMRAPALVGGGELALGLPRALAAPSASLRAATLAALERRRFFILLPSAILFGMIAYAAIGTEPSGALLWGMAAALALLAFTVRRSLAGGRWALLAGAAWFGFCLLPLHGWAVGTPMLRTAAYGLYEARVDAVLSESPEQRRIVISAITPLEGAREVPIRRARILVPAEPPLGQGDTIRANLRLAPVPGPVVPGGYDGQFHNYFAGIGAYGNVTSGLERVARAGWEAGRVVEDLRRTIRERIDAVLDPPASAIGWAMVVGDQSAITDDVRDVMGVSGLAHIFSISGLHLSMVAGGMFVFVRMVLAASYRAGLLLPVKKIAAVGGLLIAGFYLLLAGGMANVPAFRSTIMLGLVFGAVLAGRRALTMRNVVIAALVILVIDPASAFRPSFQLSFAAVVALIGAYETPRKREAEARGFFGRMRGAVWGMALTSLIAGLATLLFSAYHFQQTAPLGVLGNVLALPIVGFVVMPAALVGVLAMPLGLDEWPLRVMGWGIERVLDIAVLVTDWSGGLESHPLLLPVALVFGLGGLAWFSFFTTRWRLVGPLAVVPLVVLFGFDQRPDILIADTTQAVVVRTGEGLGLVTGRNNTFAVNVWTETYGEPIASQAEGQRCDSLACLVVGEGGFTASVVRGRDAFADDCGHADLVVARVYAPIDCRALTTVIDQRDVTLYGVHWLRWDAEAGGFEIRPAITDLGRPWRLR